MHQLANQPHSQWVLNHLREYDSFLDSLKIICDMGCGAGLDTYWWATLETRDDPPLPYNYKCFAVDRDPGKLAQIPKAPNIHKFEYDFNKDDLPTPVDLIWSHDSLQYSTNPIATLAHWNRQMNVNGMLIISVPMHTGVEYNKFYSRTHSGCFYHFTPATLIYMLAVNGFDCNDAYLYKRFNDTWLQMAVYKSNIDPMDPEKTSLLDLADKGLLNPSVVESINRYGHIRQEEILYPWLDKENYFIDWIPQKTEIPEGIPTTENGIRNTEKESSRSSIKSGPTIKKGTDLLNPVGVLRQSKKKYE